MASVEAALNIDTIEQSQVEAFRNAFSAELASFMVASETDGPQGRVAQAVVNIAEGVHAVGERAQALGEAVTPRRAVAILATGALAVAGGASAYAAVWKPKYVRAGSSAITVPMKQSYKQGCVDSLVISGRDTSQRRRNAGTLTGYFRGNHMIAILNLSKGARACVKVGDTSATSEQFLARFKPVDGNPRKLKFVDPQKTNTPRSVYRMGISIDPAGR